MQQETTSALPPVTIVQIALKPYGLEAFRAFVASYRDHPAGVAHLLVIALKGFADADDAAPFLALLEGIDHSPLVVPDGGLDIGTYLHVAATVPAQHYLFFNSRTVIDAPDYARKLLDCLRTPGVGAVGATASWQSLATDRYRATHANPMLRPIWRLKGRLHGLWWRRLFPPFPNPHLRTNGLMIARETLARLRTWPIHGKMDAMRFESGWRGLSRQLAGLGMGVRLVDRDGGCWDVAAWRRAGVFWSGGQRALMVKDNQTELYAASPPAVRALLEARGWTRPGDPLPPLPA